MKGRFLSLLFVSVLVMGKVSFAAPDPIEVAFQAANASMEKERYAEALAQYRIVLKAEPDEPASLWNGGSAAYFIGDYKTASTLFERLQKQEPNNGHLIAKRIQTAQESKDLKTRNILRTRLLALHNSGKDSTGYAAKPSYCRDQFQVGKDKVLAFEYFELKSRSGKKDQPYLGRRYDFYVAGSDGKEKLQIECGWSSLDITADGKFVPSHEMPAFYFDAYYPTGPFTRRTFGLGPTEPSFEASKAMVIAIIQGTAKPVSGQPRKAE